MSTTTKSLALTVVIAASIAVMAADSAPRSRADELRSAAPGSVQGGAAQSASGQGSSAQGTWDAVTLGRVEPRLGEIKITAPLPGGRIAEVLVELPNPGPLVVGEQVDVYFKSDRSEQVETQ